MIVYAGHVASFAMLIATFVVLFNGLVIYFITKRFKRGGGYYVYAFYSLTSKLGLNTGWNYLLYALAYGGTLLTGGPYVLYTILSTYLTTYLPPIFQYRSFGVYGKPSRLSSPQVRINRDFNNYFYSPQ